MNIFKELLYQFKASNGVLSLDNFSFLCRYCSLKLPKEFVAHAPMPYYARILKGYLRKYWLSEKEVAVIKHYKEIWPLYASALRLKRHVSTAEQKFLIADFPDELFAKTVVLLDKDFVDKMIIDGKYNKLRCYADKHGLPTSTEILFAKKADDELRKGNRECFETLLSYIDNCFGAFANYDSWVALLAARSSEIVKLTERSECKAKEQQKKSVK